MSTGHPLTEEQLDALVDELQDRLGDSTARTYGRRGVLAALGLATLGTGPTSAQASGSVGTAGSPVDVEGYDVTASNSFTDPAGVTHSGELADLSDVGASGQWQEVNSGSNIEPIDGETIGTGTEDVDVGSVSTDELRSTVHVGASQSLISTIDAAPPLTEVVMHGDHTVNSNPDLDTTGTKLTAAGDAQLTLDDVKIHVTADRCEISDIRITNSNASDTEPRWLHVDGPVDSFEMENVNYDGNSGGIGDVTGTGETQREGRINNVTDVSVTDCRVRNSNNTPFVFSSCDGVVFANNDIRDVIGKTTWGGNGSSTAAGCFCFESDNMRVHDNHFERIDDNAFNCSGGRHYRAHDNTCIDTRSMFIGHESGGARAERDVTVRDNVHRGGSFSIKIGYDNSSLEARDIRIANNDIDVTSTAEAWTPTNAIFLDYGIPDGSTVEITNNKIRANEIAVYSRNNVDQHDVIIDGNRFYGGASGGGVAVCLLSYIVDGVFTDNWVAGDNHNQKLLNQAAGMLITGNNFIGEPNMDDIQIDGAADFKNNRVESVGLTVLSGGTDVVISENRFEAATPITDNGTGTVQRDNDTGVSV